MKEYFESQWGNVASISEEFDNLRDKTEFDRLLAEIKPTMIKLHEIVLRQAQEEDNPLSEPEEDCPPSEPLSPEDLESLYDIFDDVEDGEGNRCYV